MNFDYTDDQQAIKSTARDFLAARRKADAEINWDQRPA